MADEYKRINLLIGTQTGLATGQEEGMPGIVSDYGYRLGVYAAGAWRIMALRGSSESFADVTLTGGTANALVRLDASKKSTPSLVTDDGTTVSVYGQALKKRSFACIYRTGAAVAQSIPNGATYTKITPFTANMAGNVGSTPDFANNKITIDRAGIYMVGFTRSYFVGTANTTWIVAVFVDGVVVPQSIQTIKIASTNTPIYTDLDVPVACNAGSVVDFRVQHDAGAPVSMSYQYATLSVQAID